MKHLAALVVTALTIITATAEIAIADRVVLHANDSITLDGTTYVCGDDGNGSVALALGDRLTVGRHELRCKGDHALTPKAPPVTVQSQVDLACIPQLMQMVSGYAPNDEAIRWADACRPFEIGKQCTITSQTDDTSCSATLLSAIGGSFTDREQLRAQSSCRIEQATCPAQPTAVESSVDESCLTNLFQAHDGYPDDQLILAWLDSCRATTVGACTIVGGAQDMSCMNAVFQMHDGYLSPHLAGTVARACRTLQLACP